VEVRRFSKELSKIPGVNTEVTQNLADALSPPKLNFLLRALIRRKQDELTELFRGVLIGDDNQTTAIVLRLLPEEETTVPRAETFRRIRSLAKAHTPVAYVVGEPVQVHDMFRYVEEDGDILFKSFAQPAGHWFVSFVSTVTLGHAASLGRDLFHLVD